MQIEPRTIKDAADAIDIPIGTVRQWVKDFEHTAAFSSQATPEKGRTRIFTDDDLIVLWTIRVMRAERRTTDEIAEALAAGERYHPQEETAASSSSSTGDDDEGEGETAEAAELASSLQQALAIYENRLAAYDERIEALTDDLLSMQERAVKAETELRILRDQAHDKTPQDEKTADQPGFWARFFGR